MTEKKNIKRNKNRVTKEEFLRSGRKGHSKIVLTYPENKHLQKLVDMGLL
jgi:hypothetical protein